MASEEGGNERARKLLEALPHIGNIIREVVRLLVAGQYTDLEKRGDGKGLSATEIEAAVVRCSRTLRVNRLGPGEELNYSVRDSANGKSWSVACDLWTREGHGPEISLKFTVTESDASELQVAIDDVALKPKVGVV